MYIHYKGRLNEEDERRERPCYTHYTQIRYVYIMSVSLKLPFRSQLNKKFFRNKQTYVIINSSYIGSCVDLERKKQQNIC